MPGKRRGLGRGLDSLLPKVESSSNSLKISDLKVSKYQPRKNFEPEAIAELAKSIADKGVLQPLLVRKVGKSYEIVAGERRFRAAKQAGLTEVPVIIRDLTDQETLEIAIIENLQRENLNAVEEAEAFKQLLDFGLSQEEVAKSVGKSRSAVANTLRLLNLPTKARNALAKGEIRAGHARAILSKPEEQREWALQEIINNDLSVRQAENLMKSELPTVTKRSRSASDQRYAELIEDLSKHLGTKVKISGGSKGKLELFFYSTEELERLLETLGYQA